MQAKRDSSLTPHLDSGPIVPWAVDDPMLAWTGQLCPESRQQCGLVFILPTPTVLRCLGIPTRVVTNYNSAHDQNSNLLIEYFRNEYGELESNKSEMIW